MTYNPFILAIVKNSPHLYGQALHIAPKLQPACRPHYDPLDLSIFKTYHKSHAEMDALVHSLEDESAIMEVCHWRRLMTERAKLEHNMQHILQSIHDAGMKQEQIQIRMESANLLAHLEYTRSLCHPQHGHCS